MIIDRIQQTLAGCQRLTAHQIASRIPELSGIQQADEIVRLLLRLDARFDQDGDTWYSKVEYRDKQMEVVQAAQAYLQSRPRGVLLAHLGPEIATITGQPISEVEKIILQNFRSLQGGKLILNQSKESA